MALCWPVHKPPRVCPFSLVHYSLLQLKHSGTYSEHLIYFEWAHECLVAGEGPIEGSLLGVGIKASILDSFRLRYLWNIEVEKSRNEVDMRVWDQEDLGGDVNVALWWVLSPKESWWITLGKSTEKRNCPRPYPHRYEHVNVEWQKKMREVWWCQEIKRVNALRRKERSTAERSGILKKKKKE